MKIGIYTGSFDPMHLGHLRLIAQALDRHKLEQVVIVPTMQNPIKRYPPLDIEIRKQIIEHELAQMNDSMDVSRVSVDLLERQLSPPYYTYRTLRKLRSKYPEDELYIIMGEDCRAAIKYWSHSDEILQNYSLIVTDRTAESSTEIRRRIVNKERLTGLVPAASEDYINTQYIKVFSDF